jgi:hypothetical protein
VERGLLASVLTIVVLASGCRHGDSEAILTPSERSFLRSAVLAESKRAGEPKPTNVIVARASESEVASLLTGTTQVPSEERVLLVSLEGDFLVVARKDAQLRGHNLVLVFDPDRRELAGTTVRDRAPDISALGPTEKLVIR